jgi:hypothetical protein
LTDLVFLFFRLKRKAETMGPTPVKSLRASAAVLNRSAEQDAAWVREVEAAKERRRQQEAAGASTVAGPDPAAAGSEPARVVAPGPVEAGPKSLPTAEVTAEAAAEGAAADATAEGAAPGSEREAASARGPQPQQDPPVQTVGAAAGEVTEPSTGAPGAAAPEVVVPVAGAPAVGAPVSEPPSGEVPAPEASTVEAPAPEVLVAEGPVTADGRAPVVIALDDAPLDKGKEVMGAEEGETASRAVAPIPAGAVEAAGEGDEAGPSTGPGGAPAASSSSWPDFAALAIARAEEEIPRWGGPPLQFKDAANLDAEPILTLNDRDEVHRWQYLEGVRQHLARLLSVASEAVSRGMRDATEVRLICQLISRLLSSLFFGFIMFFGFP